MAKIYVFGNGYLQRNQNIPFRRVICFNITNKKIGYIYTKYIAEGYGREGTKDYLRFLNIALSSLFELQTQIEIAHNLKFLKEENFNKLYENTREIERMLTSFIKKINV